VKLKNLKKNPVTVAGFFICFHVTAVLWWVLPSDNSFKAVIQQTFIGRIFSDYMHLSGTTQSWRMFAPNPTQVDRRIMIYAVKAMVPAYGVHPETPLNDPNPVYTSASSEKSFWYENDTKMAFFLTSTQSEVFLKPFAEYWGHFYEKKTGHLPVAINVVLAEGKIPPLFSQSGKPILDTGPTYGRQVIWQTKF
jgi:hypothetical protein